jgi:hypothetical protein
MSRQNLHPKKYCNLARLHENGATMRGFAWDSEPFPEGLPKFG